MGIPFRHAFLLALVGANGCGPTPTPPPAPTVSAPAEFEGCVLDVADMPAAWRPASGQHNAASNQAWTQTEQDLADLAVQIGQKELTQFLTNQPEVIPSLWDNAVECFIDVTYAATNTPKLKTEAYGQAQKMLAVISAPYLSLPLGVPTCSSWSELLTLAVYHQALERGTDAHHHIVGLANAAWVKCDDLQEAMGSDFRHSLQDPKSSNDTIYDLVMWSITLTEARLVDGLITPPGAADLLPLLWKYLSTYPIPRARDYPDGTNAGAAYDAAYLATHIAYIPTGYGRYRLRIEDAPWLHTYLRENFYAALALGELDLIAEFVDLFRQYGCTEETDRQLRDGSRHLLGLYQAANKSWMAHRESYETKASNPYDLIHKPWTAVAGLRRRRFDHPTPLNYGGLVRAAIHRDLNGDQRPVEPAGAR